ncbi:demethylmenaquinone methyltransferase [Lactococcus termiticola]|uniref:Demethylmenaquinone methyltransferase n=1 Tax=Lactococcus termiticola TaxID=2169526 RepID=A0A2R5HKM5_9LACT|nr:demethylmenaquinone methyltransferase [Lactococcus termiticola]GBG97151.1 ubiquinone/menaquinone biosynthesis methyltransferase [Lactococcus termiticola]
MTNKVNQERVHEIFNKISGDYDKMNAIISFRQHDRWRASTMKKMTIPKAGAVLDLCCGTGDWTFDLAEAVGQEGHVTGLDFSENMLQIAEKKLMMLSAQGLNNVKLIQGDAMSLDFADDSFDVVTIGYGLRNTPDYLTVLKEIRRVLKPGGQVVCIDTSHPTLPVYKQGFELYFKHIMPAFGRIFAKSYKEYQWLQKSAQDFPDAKTLKGLFEEAGFKDVRYQMFGGGAVAAHFGKK